MQVCAIKGYTYIIFKICAYACEFISDRAGHLRENPQRRLSWRRALSHLKVSVHNVMLVNMIDTLQDLIDALAEKDRE